MWKSVEEVLDYAILEERTAAYTYRSFARQAATAELREVFEGFVADETAHMEKLLKARKASSLTVQQGSLSSLPRPRAVRLPADGLADAPAAYRFAIRAEKSAWALYSVLAQMAAEPRIRRTFEFLAAEEMSHRTKLEAGLKALKSSRGFFRGLIRLFRRS